MERLPALIVLLIATFAPRDALSDAIAGPVRYAIDGRTLVIATGPGAADAEIRLWGIAVPRPDRECADITGAVSGCGEYARLALKTIVGARPVVCDIVSREPSRYVARCRQDHQDLGRLMVILGWALDDRFVSGGAYLTDEAMARNQRQGVWAGEIRPATDRLPMR